MVVEELISLLKVDMDPSSVAKVEGFAGVVEKSLLGFTTALLAIPAAVAGVSAGLVQVGTKMAADMEMTTAEITTMMGGNAQQAKALIGEIRNFANVTPFETMPLVENAKTMMSMGIAAQDTVGYLKMIGDVAGGNQEKLSRFVYNFSQVKSLGKLQGEDLRQFATGGFNPLRALIEDKSGHKFTDEELKKKVAAGTMSMETYKMVVGKTTNQLQEMASKGEIGFQQLTDAFRMATSQGGLFYGNLDRMSKTVLGRWSTLTDAVKTNLLDIGGKFLPLVSRALDAIAAVVDYIGPLWVDVVDDMRVFFQSIGDGTIEDVVGSIQVVLETLITTTADLIYLIVYLFKTLEVGFRQVLIFITEPIRLLGKLLWDTLVGPLEMVVMLASLAMKAIGKTSLSDSLDNGLQKMEDFKNRMKSGVDVALDAIGASEDGLANAMMQRQFAWDQIGKDYNPRVAKPPKFEQNNTIHQEITIDPKADPSGKTSLHMKGLKEAVRSAFNIETMQILGSLRT